MSLETVTENIDTQLAALDQKLTDCQAQLAISDQKRQAFLEREIKALQETRAKLVRSRALAVKAAELRRRLDGQTQPPAPKPNYGRIALILVVAVLASIATLIFT